MHTLAQPNAVAYGLLTQVLRSLLSSTDRIVQEVDSVEYGLTDIQVRGWLLLTRLVAVQRKVVCRVQKCGGDSLIGSRPLRLGSSAHPGGI